MKTFYLVTLEPRKVRRHTVDPPNTAALRTDKNRQYWKTAVKGVNYNQGNQEKTYSGLTNQRRYGGGGANIELSHWYKVDKVFYTPEAKLRCVKITSYITKRS